MKKELRKVMEDLEAAYRLTAEINVSGSGVDALAEVRARLRQAFKLVGDLEKQEDPHG